MASVKSWRQGTAGEPYFPADFEIVKKAVLQVTDIKDNHNKYYAIEIHKAEEKGTTYFRVFTHYGRTDDLDTNPNAGAKECRYFNSLAEAEAEYQRIYKEKTNPRKGYKEVALASSKIGSQKARGTSSGEVDAKTLEKLAAQQAAENGAAQQAAVVSKLPAPIADLVRYIYDEATNALTTTVNAKITAAGIETPLGILTLGQIDKGELVLLELYDEFLKAPGPQRDNALQRLSSDFYSAIPHRIGRTKAAIRAATINTLEAIEQKQNTLQLMKDMLQVNGDGGNVLFNAQVDSEYAALKCHIEPLEQSGGEFKELADYVHNSQVKHRNVKVKNIFRVRREGEHEAFHGHIDNQRMLFHGSRIQNWVGLLTRGILLPKIVVSLGVNRTDAGWLGNGIYFGDAACTSSFYTTPGKKKTRFMTIARVALGKMKEFTKITYGLTSPPPGFDSCHGVRRKPGVTSQFDDDEYVVYTTNQQRMEYLVEFTA